MLRLYPIKCAFGLDLDADNRGADLDLLPANPKLDDPVPFRYVPFVEEGRPFNRSGFHPRRASVPSGSSGADNRNWLTVLWPINSARGAHGRLA